MSLTTAGRRSCATKRFCRVRWRSAVVRMGVDNAGGHLEFERLLIRAERPNLRKRLPRDASPPMSTTEQDRFERVAARQRQPDVRPQSVLTALAQTERLGLLPLVISRKTTTPTISVSSTMGVLLYSTGRAKRRSVERSRRLPSAPRHPTKASAANGLSWFSGSFSDAKLLNDRAHRLVDQGLRFPARETARAGLRTLMCPSRPCRRCAFPTALRKPIRCGG